MTNLGNYSVLVVGCDKHRKLLDRFFLQFTRYWNDPTVDIYLSLEDEDYSYGDLKIKVTNFGSSWSTRVKKTLEQINSSAILLLLDDFLVESPVEHEELNKLAELISSTDEIAHFALTTVPMKNQSDTLFYDKYYLRHHFGRYKTTLQAGMWNRKELISVIKPGESAWSFEIQANFRSYLSERKYYAIAKKELKPIEYNEGLFCIQGKLNTYELDRLKEKFDEDFRVDGMEDNGGVIIRDPCPFIKKIFRKIKVITYDLVYRLKWWFKK